MKNPYVFPSHVAQVFFMNRHSNPNWKVILSNEPKTCQIVGKCEHHVFAASGSTINADDMIPTRDVHHSEQGRINLMADREVPLQKVQAMNIGMEVEVHEDEIYVDDLYKDELFSSERWNVNIPWLWPLIASL